MEMSSESGTGGGSRAMCTIIGDAFVDLVCIVDPENSRDGPLLRPGGDTLLKTPVQILPGGSGLNTATHLHCLSLREEATLKRDAGNVIGSKFDIRIQTMLDEEDSYGSVLMGHCSRIKLNIQNLHPGKAAEKTKDAYSPCQDKSKTCSWATGHCVVVVSHDDRSFLTHRGCIEHFHPRAIDFASMIAPLHQQELEQGRQERHHIHLAGYYNLPQFWNGTFKETLQVFREQSERNNITTSLVPQYDATEEWDGGLLDLLSLIDILFMSEGESAGITKYREGQESAGDPDPKRLIHHVAAEIQKTSPKTLVIMTLGANGAVALQDGTIVATQPGFTLPGPVIDATGAGDAFAAGFLAVVMEQQQQKVQELSIFDPTFLDKWLQAALQMGCALGAACVMKEGASTLLSRQDINPHLSRSCHDVIFNSRR